MKTYARRRCGKVLTAQNLENAALFYLSRYAASEFSLRRVLENKLRRAALQNPQFARDNAAQTRLRSVIDIIIEKHKKAGVINDLAFAEMKIITSRRAGRSARAIRQRLARSGIAPEVVGRALDHDADGETTEKAELRAAMHHARRRKLGPFRKSDAGPDQRRKDLAVLARAGFSLDVARKVLDKNTDNEPKAGF